MDSVERKQTPQKAGPAAGDGKAAPPQAAAAGADSGTTAAGMIDPNKAAAAYIKANVPHGGLPELNMVLPEHPLDANLPPYLTHDAYKSLYSPAPGHPYYGNLIAPWSPQGTYWSSTPHGMYHSPVPTYFPQMGGFWAHDPWSHYTFHPMTPQEAIMGLPVDTVHIDMSKPIDPPKEYIEPSLPSNQNKASPVPEKDNNYDLPDPDKR